MTELLGFTTHTPGETRAVGRALAPLLQPGDVILLSGPLGAGKTELAKGIAAGLGVEETVVSPTFTIVREYQGRLPVLHADVYRLEHAQELFDLGLEDLAADTAVTVVEWGDAVADLLPADHLEVRIDLPDDAPDAASDEAAPDDDRVLQFTTSGPLWRVRGLALADAVTADAR